MYRPTGTLYIAGTPIGNLEDLTFRVLRYFREADVVYAEDTRVTRKILAHYSVEQTLRSFRQSPNRGLVERTVQEVIQRLREGETVMYVTDAGTPGISDAGSYLVHRVVRAGLPVVPLPGASAVSTLISVAGIPAQRTLTVGFLPKKKGRQSLLLRLATALGEGVCDAVVFFESPERIGKLLDQLAEWPFPDLRLCLGRELTKIHEEILRGSIAEVREQLDRKSRIRGEITLAVYRELNAEDLERSPYGGNDL
jgi:16S rRNA (cytidine1402-2'-O)-methyltransferase